MAPMARLPPELRSLLTELPRSLAEEIEGYSSSVSDAYSAIASEVGVPRNQREELEGEFVFAAAIRRLWTLLDTQYWILSHSLGLLASQDVGTVRLGGTRYSRDSRAFRDVRALRDDLQSVVRGLGIEPHVNAPSLSDLASILMEERGWTRKQ